MLLKIFSTAILLLQFNDVQGVLDTHFTLRSTWGRLHLSSTGAETVIRCTSYDSDPSEMRFGRVMDAGNGIELPPFYREFGSQQSPFGRALHMGSINGSIRFGAYFCEESQDNQKIRITTLKLPPYRIAEIDPVVPYKVVNIGENVTLRMKELVPKEKTILWLRNGTIDMPQWTDSLEVIIPNVTKEDQGVYECFYEGERSNSLHGIMRLIVRGCPAGFYGENCNKTCQACYNGGICHEETGDCICPPGFADGQCEKACGGNKFGANCEQLCYKQTSQFSSGQQNLEAGCKFFLFCKLDPYGCTCAPGFHGSTCDEDCNPGTFGPDCSQTCHCKDGVPCHYITGKCPDQCDKGWFGENCQISKDILSRPDISVISESVVNVGSTKNVSCQATGLPAPFVTLSFSNGTEVTDAVWESYEGIAIVSFDLRTSESGNLTLMCNATNVHGFALKKFSVIVVDPPKILTQPLLINKTEESLTIQWFTWEYGKDFGGVSSDKPLCKPQHRLLNSTTWLNSTDFTPSNVSVIGNLSPFTEYEITIICKRDGNFGTGEPGPFAIFRTDCGVPAPFSAPEFKTIDSSSSSIDIAWKDPIAIALKCSVEGYVLSYHPTNKASSIVTVQIKVSPKRNYTISNLKPFTQYELTLTPMTTKGLTNYPSIISSRTAEWVPGKVSNIKRKYLSSYDKITLSWSIPLPRNGIITHYRVSYLLSNIGMCGKLSSNSTFMQVQVKANYVTLTDLKPFSLYNTKIAAATQVGYGESKSFDFVSWQSVPQSAPKNLRTLTVGTEAIDVMWDPVPCLERRGRFASYQYYLDEVNSVEQNKIMNFNTSGNHCHFKLLKPNTYYEIKVRQFTDEGPGPFSESLRVKTVMEVPKTPKLTVNQSDSEYLILEWTAASIYAPVSGYIIEYEKVTNTSSSPRNIEIQDLANLNISNLSPITEYSFKIQAINKRGFSNWSEKFIVKTLERMGEAPRNLTLVRNTDSKIEISWISPILNAFVVTGYKVSYEPVAKDEDEVNIPSEVFLSADSKNVTINNLTPVTKYIFKISTITKRGIGESVTEKYATKEELIRNVPTPIVLMNESHDNEVPITFYVKNDSNSISRVFQVVVGIGVDANVNDELLMNYSLAVQEKIPYYIAAEFDSLSAGSHRFMIGDEIDYGGYYNAKLKYGLLHNVWIRVIFNSDEGSISILSPPGKPIFFEAHKEDPVDSVNFFGFPLVYFILIIFAALFIIILLTFCLAHVIRRRQLKKNSGAYTVTESSQASHSWRISYTPSVANTDEHADDQYPLFTKIPRSSKKERGSLFRRSSKRRCNDIPIAVFPDYFKEKLTSQDNNFTHEFKLLPVSQQFSWTHAKKPENTSKNRYGNVLPYDHSRVVLKHKGRSSPDDYINANYVDGAFRKREYIITQGPKPNTAADFWHMIWQEKSSAIVMVTLLVENNKPKCNQYWPNESKYYEDIQVMQIHSEDHESFQITTFLIRKPKADETRRVVLYWFKDWYDKSAPDDTTMLLRMRNRIRSDLPSTYGPIVIHCSAGVGRAGSFAAIDAQCLRAERDKAVNIFDYVSKIRTQRMNLVQTIEQYLFVHEALLEAIVTRDTEVGAEDLPMYINKLNSISESGLTGMQHQYSMIARLADKQLHAGNRASLLPFIDDECSLNLPDTMLIPGYGKKKAYLVTSTPNVDTATEFWGMIYRNKSSVIVMLNELHSGEPDQFSQDNYWPKEGCKKYGHYEVEAISFEALKHVHLRTMKVTNTTLTDSKPHAVVHLQYFEWPETMLAPSTAKGVMALIDLISHWNVRISNLGPITIHCRDGVSQSGLICAVSTIKEEMNATGSVDVFKICKRLCSTHIDFISTMEQYKFCYEIALYIYKTSSIYL